MAENTENTVTTKIKTTREISDSELRQALQNSMGPIFTHFEEEIAERGKAKLTIEIYAEKNKVNLCYGFAKVEDLDCSVFQKSDSTPK